MFYDVAKVIVKGFIHLIYRYRVVGAEHIPQEGGYMVCSNHRSDLDPILIGLAIPHHLTFMAKQQLFKIPGFGALIRSLGAFPVVRNTADMSAIKASFKILRSGGVLTMFPEGGRSKDGKLRKFKQGAGLISCKTGAKILPACILGTYRPFAKMRVVFGEPIDPAAFESLTDDEKSKAVNAALHEAISSLRGVDGLVH